MSRPILVKLLLQIIRTAASKGRMHHAMTQIAVDCDDHDPVEARLKFLPLHATARDAEKSILSTIVPCSFCR